MANGQLTIGVCGEADRRAALGLVLRSLPAENRASLVESLGKLVDEPLAPFAALVAAKQGSEVVAAAWAQPQPGRTASVWLPETDGVAMDDVALPLLREALRQVDAAGVAMSQSLLEPEENLQPSELLAVGFERLTELEYQEWGCDDKKLDRLQVQAPELGRADSLPPRELEALVESTYVDTRDCPELEGLRPVADVLAGYKQTGDYDPALWLVLELNGAPAGVLLLSEHRASRQMELTYMGVAPSARGNGLGKRAVIAAQRFACERGCERLVLAVDKRNAAATSIYSQAGFRAWASRVVFIRPAPRQT